MEQSKTGRKTMEPWRVNVRTWDSEVELKEVSLYRLGDIQPMVHL